MEFKDPVPFHRLVEFYTSVRRNGALVYCYVNNIEVHIYKQVGINKFWFDSKERLTL